ncbi:MAG: PD-(D/E)XK nuclease family protein [Limisphaerales bacterium]
MNLAPDYRGVRVHFLLGPAGSGKTWRCLDETRAELLRAPGDPAPLLLLAPKQATFQLERQLLDDPQLAGYARLQIVSFDRLARWLLDTFAAVPDLLDDEGRVMVLRALLAREQDSLKVFRATARLPGFARQLSQLLREFQRHQVTPDRLARLAGRCDESPQLRDKLHDLHHLLRAYHAWLAESEIQDADHLLDLATAMLRSSPSPISHLPFPISGLWLDGFAEMTPQELDLLCAVLPLCRKSTLAFCLGPEAEESKSWLSLWSVVRRTYLDCRTRIKALPNSKASDEQLARDPAHSRFRDSPALAHLEANWTAPAASSPSPPSGERAGVRGQSVPSPEAGQPATAHPPSPLRLALCAHPEAEATLAAREIHRHVRTGGRFRDCAVILRTLDHHHAPLRRVFTRFGIPFFLDRREPVTHHPLAELTRFALRTLAYGWQLDDWFGALKTGLVHDRDEDIDWLENLALAHGWHGDDWLAPLNEHEPAFDLPRAERLRVRLVLPFCKLSESLKATPSPSASSPSPPPGERAGVRGQRAPSQTSSQIPGSDLAAAFRILWEDLTIESRLQAWDDTLARDGDTPVPHPAAASAIHASVLRQMHEWLDNLELAFPAGSAALSLREWLPIVEAGLGALSVGVIPPALDQVLVGTIDRSRNPELKLALVLGLNEGVFPAPPAPPVLLSDSERALLADLDTRLGSDPRAQLAHERYFAYIACTRSRARLVLTCAAAGADGEPLHPSPILAHVQQLFPDVLLEKIPTTADWREAEHTEELLEPILRDLATEASSPSPPPGERAGVRGQATTTQFVSESPTSALPPHPQSLSPDGGEGGPQSALLTLATLPTLAPVIARWRQHSASRTVASLSHAAVTQLYGTELGTSVSKLEQFAECPFKFFVAAGLRAEERKEFELDPRERGSFLHRLLDEFHLRVTRSGRRWRDVSPTEARTLVATIGADLLAQPEHRLLAADDARRFTAHSLIASAQRLLVALVGWMPHYDFDPIAVELGFGLKESPLPAWRLDLADGNALLLRGRIDRVDLCRVPETGETLAVVVDYKSSPKKLESLKVASGLQLQLLSYLNVLHAQPVGPDLTPILPTPLRPAGVFYVNLHGASGSGGTRAEILAENEADRRAAYQHSGRFDFAQLKHFDREAVGGPGSQFRFKVNKDGQPAKRGNDALPTTDFTALLAQVEANLRRLGSDIFAGDIRVAPMRMSASESACDRCDYRAICRFDPWTEPYRKLVSVVEAGEGTA